MPTRGQKIHGVENKTDLFIRFGHVCSLVTRAPEHLIHQTNIKTFNEDEEDPHRRCVKINIQQVLSSTTLRKFTL
jgi:hypothetical protein